jgi:hypothetical protein
MGVLADVERGGGRGANANDSFYKNSYRTEKWEEKPYLKVVLLVYISILVIAGVQRVAQHLSQLILLPAPPHPHSFNRVETTYRIKEQSET